MGKRKRSRGYANSRRKSVKPSFAPVILLLCLSVGCGYATAKYVVEPVVNYAPQLTAEKEQSKQDSGKKEAPDKAKQEVTQDAKEIVEDDIRIQETGIAEGYAVQFGCYSSKDAAEGVKSTLTYPGIQVLKQDDMYKVIGTVFKTKEEAVKSMESLAEKEKAFVTTIYK